jgi:hypothetical protein
MQYHMTISGQDLQNNLTKIVIKVNQTNISGAVKKKIDTAIQFHHNLTRRLAVAGYSLKHICQPIHTH